MKKQVEEIRKNSESIIRASEKIQTSCETIARSYIEAIEDKIANFEVKIKKEYRAYEQKVKV